ncbi:MAG TPA: glycosyltransferase family 2 protein [Stenomitos sp.]
MLDVTIVIPNLNGASVLGACLSALPAAAGPLRYQAVVVDNASRDESVSLVRSSFPDALVVENPENLGFAVACNRGAQPVESRYVLLLNNDVTLLPETLEELVAFADAHPQAGGLSPLMCWPDGRPQGPKLGLAGRLNRGAVPMGWLPGTCLLLRREALEHVGWLDEDFFFYNEDLDLSWRLRKGGWDLYCLPNVRVRHIEGHATRSDLEVRARAIAEGYRGSVILTQKHYPWATGIVRAGIRASVALQTLSLHLKRRFRGGLTEREEAVMLAAARLGW